MWRGGNRKLRTAFEHTLPGNEVFGGVPYRAGDRVRDFETRNFGWRVLLSPITQDRPVIAKE